jgi:membrane protease YdiL (CAAX protease family)
MEHHRAALGAIFFVLLSGSLAVWIHVGRSLRQGQSPMEREPHPAVPWTLGDVLVLAVLWPFLELGTLELLTGHGAPMHGALSTRDLTAITVGHLLWTIAAVAYLEIKTGARPSQFGFDATHIARDVRSGALTFLAALVPVYAIQIVVSQWFAPEEHPLARLVTEHPSASLMALAVFSAVVVAPIGEELLFRVILQGWLERQAKQLRSRGGNAALLAGGLPIFASSALFASMHQGYARVALFVLALFLGYLYQQTHRIFPSMILHGCFNGLTMLGLWLAMH